MYDNNFGKQLTGNFGKDDFKKEFVKLLKFQASGKYGFIGSLTIYFIILTLVTVAAGIPGGLFGFTILYSIAQITGKTAIVLGIVSLILYAYFYNTDKKFNDQANLRDEE